MRVFVIFLLAFASLSSSSQEIKAKRKSAEAKSEISTSSEGKRKVTVHENGTTTISKSNRTPQQRYSSGNSSQSESQTPDYQGQINAIKKKIEWVRSNPDEHQKAEENGWYDKMNARIKELESKIKTK